MKISKRLDATDAITVFIVLVIIMAVLSVSCVPTLQLNKKQPPPPKPGSEDCTSCHGDHHTIVKNRDSLGTVAPPTQPPRP